MAKPNPFLAAGSAAAVYMGTASTQSAASDSHDTAGAQTSDAGVTPSVTATAPGKGTALKKGGMVCKACGDAGAKGYILGIHKRRCKGTQIHPAGEGGREPKQPSRQQPQGIAKAEPASSAAALLDHWFLPFQEACAHVLSLNLKSLNEWQNWCRSGTRPANVPSHPDQTYKDDGWQGYGHWLGYSKSSTCMQRLVEDGAGAGSAFIPISRAQSTGKVTGVPPPKIQRSTKATGVPPPKAHTRDQPPPLYAACVQNIRLVPAFPVLY